MNRRKKKPQTFIIHKNNEEYEIWDKETKEIARKQHTNQTIKRGLVSGLVYIVKGIVTVYRERKALNTQYKIDVENKATENRKKEREKRIIESKRREQKRLEREIMYEKQDREIKEWAEKHLYNTVRK